MHATVHVHVAFEDMYWLAGVYLSATWRSIHWQGLPECAVMIQRESEAQKATSPRLSSSGLSGPIEQFCGFRVDWKPNLTYAT